ncbi:MAG TPA: hypothetical protein PLF26_13660 [Blastocatellia bacterium]|nr:hypothetical protein [Blastocatellia bacterium]
MATLKNNRWASLVATMLLAAAAMCAAACEPANTAAPGGNTAAQNASNAPVAATNAAPTAPGTMQPPLGSEDNIEGTVVGLICYKENPKAPPEKLAECAKANLEKGGYLGVLGADGTLYINADADVRVNNAQLRDFVGQQVTVQGQMIGDAPQLSWEGVTVKKFKMKLVRRKGPPPAGTPKNMTNTGQAGGAPPPVKKP